ncbi:hypothetical protein [Vibrio rarus]|uniref:hypothetical protein n=1 Tax=Vibrio rarus TaxID=413403 RepID=UPI0021C31EAE|nr:hypothetical protein [Vibrio rarus]
MIEQKKHVSSTHSGGVALYLLTALAGIAVGITATTFYLTQSHQQIRQIEQQSQQQKANELTQLQSLNQTLEQSLKQSQSEASHSQQQLQKVTHSLGDMQKRMTEQGLQHKQLQQKIEQQQRLVQQQQLLESQLRADNQELQQQVDEHRATLNDSKSFFQQQMALQRELTKLHVQREKLIVILNSLVKECQTYQDGKSWDAKSDSCSRKQTASDRLKTLDQTIDAKQAKVVSFDSE